MTVTLTPKLKLWSSVRRGFASTAHWMHAAAMPLCVYRTNFAKTDSRLPRVCNTHIPPVTYAASHDMKVPVGLVMRLREVNNRKSKQTFCVPAKLIIISFLNLAI